jgi:NDP-hexose 4-ketoreductase
MAGIVVLGQGWLGSAVVQAAESRYPVTAVDPPLHPVLRHRDRAAKDALRELVEAADATAVINACGLLNGTDEDLRDANATFPAWVCEALGGLGVRLVHVGSASEYGDPGTAGRIGEDTPARPVGAYASTKALGSEAVLRARSDGLEAVVARVFNLVGSPVPPVSPLHQWISDIRALPPGGGAVEVWWPSTTRDFVRLSDAAESLLDLAVSGTPPALVNLCSGTGLRFGDIVETLAARLGTPARVRSLDRPGIEAVVGDPSLLRRCTGRAPRMDLDTLARTALDGLAPTGGTGGANR